MSMLKTLTKSISEVSVFSITLGVAVFLSSIPGSVAQVVATPAFGLASVCGFVNPNRLECKFRAARVTNRIQYISMQCTSTGKKQISLDLFQFLASPPNAATVELAYQIPLTSRTSLGGGDVGNALSAGSPVAVYVAANSAPRALIDLTPSPSGTTQCTVSVSGVRE
jgi:hypothetical protein